jgi:tRNA threonylcarbamoyladenosine biosynthesis protein TsaB
VIVAGIETSTLAQSLCLVEGEVERARIELPASAGHGRLLAGAFASMLDQAGVRVGDLGLIVVGAGPGSFTGLRIGLAFARGVSFAARVPVALECSLTALAYAALSDGAATRAAVVMDARRGELYAGTWEAALPPAPVVPVHAYTPATFADALRGLTHAQTVLVGDGVDACADALAARGVPFALREGLRVPDVASLVRVAIARGTRGSLGKPLEPAYVRPPDAKLPAVAQRAPT